MSRLSDVEAEEAGNDDAEEEEERMTEGNVGDPAFGCKEGEMAEKRRKEKERRKEEERKDEETDVNKESDAVIKRILTTREDVAASWKIAMTAKMTKTKAQREKIQRPEKGTTKSKDAPLFVMNRITPTRVSCCLIALCLR